MSYFWHEYYKRHLKEFTKEDRMSFLSRLINLIKVEQKELFNEL